MTEPLQGQRILVTREKKQALSLAEKIEQYGGDPVITDLIKIDCVPHETEQAIQQITAHDWLFFTSANGVHCFFRLLNGEQTNVLKNKSIAVVGGKTEHAINDYGYEAAFVPSRFNAETMADEFTALHPTDRSVLLIQGQRARSVLMDAFRKEKRPFSRLVVYETNTNDEMKDPLNRILRKHPPDFITFTSPSTVEAFMALADDPFYNAESVIACIGTTTEKRALEAGFSQTIVPSTFTIEGMLEKIIAYVKGGHTYGDTTL